MFDERRGSLRRARSLPSGHNAACEGFFDLLKRERIYRMTYPTLDTARADVFEYIERFHNPRMRRRTARHDLKFSTLSQPSVISG
jgi:putative transposase